MGRAMPDCKIEVQCVTGDQATARAHSILCIRSQAVAETVI